MTPDTLSKILRATPQEVLELMSSGDQGLTTGEAGKRLELHGPNTIRAKRLNALKILWRQIGGNPLVIVLATATAISYAMGQHTSAYYIFGMILVSVVLGFWNEYAAERTVHDLLKRVSLTAIVERDGVRQDVSVIEVTVGDIVYLAPGSIVPADMRLIESSNLELDQSSLTGESKTVYKVAHALDSVPAGLSDYANITFMSTTVTSGSGKGAVVAIGKDTEFGKIARAASFVKPETDFQKGLRRFGELLVKVIMVLAIIIFVVNFLLGHDVVNSLLFALAIAVGLTPELLPIIVTISLSHGAGKLAKKHVISKQLVAIENLGNMDILCTDKTGTLTEGRIVVTGAVALDGSEKPALIRMGVTCNTAIRHHKLVGDAIDVALWEAADKQGITLEPGMRKVCEQPFDYERRMMFSVVEHDGVRQLVAKGAPDAILAICEGDMGAAHAKAAGFNADGQRLIAMATQTVGVKQEYAWNDLHEMQFEGFVIFLDIPKKSAMSSINKLQRLGIELKIITGDSDLVTKHVCEEVGAPIKGIILGSDLMKLDDAGQERAVRENTVFARMTPSQKLRVIELLRADGHSVGYMGDGINDIPALRSADVGISVNTAVDVAKDAAQIVLLRTGLDVIADGVSEGRRTFSNTIKYILMGTSSNFGNMFSAAGASFFLPFLPMTPSQILLNNTLYDVSQISIPTDNVDEETLKRPRHWDIRFIKYYMIFFGPISSIYDFLTFWLMIGVFHAHPSLFQTGWFVESLATQVLVVFIIRTNRVPFYHSKPSKWLLITCLTMVTIGLVLPFSPLAHGLGFVTLPALYFVFLLLLTGSYLLLVMVLRRLFLRKFMT